MVMKRLERGKTLDLFDFYVTHFSTQEHALRLRWNKIDFDFDFKQLFEGTIEISNSKIYNREIQHNRTQFESEFVEQPFKTEKLWNSCFDALLSEWNGFRPHNNIEQVNLFECDILVNLQCVSKHCCVCGEWCRCRVFEVWIIVDCDCDLNKQT